MMITGASPNCYSNGQQLYEDVIPSSLESNSSAATHPASFLYNLSLLKDKVHQVQSLATIFLSHDHGQPPPPESTAVAVPTMTTLIQEIIMTASSMMFACQQMSLTSPLTSNNNTTTVNFSSGRAVEERGPSASASAFFSDQWYCDNYNNSKSTDDHNNSIESNSRVKELILPKKKETNDVSEGLISPKNFDIVELDAADLLAKYTHYCQVCGKGFKRDANLRMHMRAHGDEYKSSAALTNPMKGNSNTTGGNTGGGILRKYSCPQEGCRWNKNHAKFQPLKSMICVKNHYKRSHCPKMYVCKRCNRKQFSVLSDLRTHEKHCGDLKWQCSCGTTFSRKDKLMGHVALFVGHTPAVGLLTKTGNGAQNSSQMQVDQSR